MSDYVSEYRTENLKDGKLTIREMLSMDINWHPPGQRDTEANSPERERDFIREVMNYGYLYKMAIAEIYDNNGKFTGEYQAVDGSHRSLALQRFKEGFVGWTPPFSPDNEELVWSELSKEDRDRFLDYDKIDIVIYKDLTPEMTGVVFRKLNDGTKVNEEEYLNSFNVEIRDIVRVLIRGSKAQVKSPVLARLGRHAQHPLFAAMQAGDGLTSSHIKRHKLDTVATKLFAIAWKKLVDGKNIYEFVNSKNLRRSLYVGPNNTQGLWRKLADRDAQLRDECVLEVLDMLDKIYVVMSKAPNGLKSFSSLATFDGMIHHMLGMEIMYDKPISKIIRDSGKYTSSWLAAHEELKANLPGNRKSEYGAIVSGWFGEEWRSKYNLVMKHTLNNGGLESMSIKPLTHRKRYFNASDKTIVWKRQEGVCFHCGKELDWDNMQAHHSPIPHSKGGPTIPDNCELLHVECHEQMHGH